MVVFLRALIMRASSEAQTGKPTQLTHLAHRVYAFCASLLVPLLVKLAKKNWTQIWRLFVDMASILILTFIEKKGKNTAFSAEQNLGFWIGYACLRNWHVGCVSNVRCSHCLKDCTELVFNQKLLTFHFALLFCLFHYHIILT